jgi:hypothetical protein
MTDKQRIAELEAQLRESVEADIVARTAAQAAERATLASEQASDQAAVDHATKQAARRGLWISHYLSKADPTVRIDLVAISEAIPEDVNAFPPGIDPTTLIFNPATVAPKFDFANSTLGQSLKRLTPIGGK